MRSSRQDTGRNTRSHTAASRLVALGVALAAVTAAASWVPTAADAHSYKLGDIAIGHIWAPPPEQGAEGLPIYGPILNRGDATVRLVGATTPIANQTRFRIAKDNQVRWPHAVTLKPGKPLALAAWREHIWLSGLKGPLAGGDSFDLTLDFGEAGQLKIKVIIEKGSGH